MTVVLETKEPKKTAKDRTITWIIKIQIVMYHLMNHDVSECLFIEVEVVGHKNRHVTLLDWFFLFPQR